MFKKIRLKMAEWFLPKGYYIDTLQTLDYSDLATKYKIAIGRSSAFKETKNEMIAQNGIVNWGDYVYNWVCLKEAEAKNEIVAYKKNAEMTVDPYRSDME